MAISVAVAVAGIVMALRTYRDRGLEGGQEWAERFPAVHRLLVNKYWVDELYDATVVRPLRRLGARPVRRIIDGVGDRRLLVVHGIAFVTEITGDLLRFFTSHGQPAQLRWLYFLLGLIGLLWIWMRVVSPARALPSPPLGEGPLSGFAQLLVGGTLTRLVQFFPALAALLPLDALMGPRSATSIVKLYALVLSLVETPGRWPGR